MHKTKHSPEIMGVDRRTALKHMALAFGLALSAQSMALMAASFSIPKDLTRRKNTALNAQELNLVRELGELIIPTTDTPGAIAAGVHDFINHQLAYCFNAQEQQEILTGLKNLDARAQTQHQHDFLSCSKTEQHALLTNMEAGQQGFTAQDHHAFKQFKSLVALGYYTSEIGASQELAYAAIPGGYKAIKFAEIGKAWAVPVGQ
jgi:hypothetical protein